MCIFLTKRIDFLPFRFLCKPYLCRHFWLWCIYAFWVTCKQEQTWSFCLSCKPDRFLFDPIANRIDFYLTLVLTGSIPILPSCKADRFLFGPRANRINLYLTFGQNGSISIGPSCKLDRFLFDCRANQIDFYWPFCKTDRFLIYSLANRIDAYVTLVQTKSIPTHLLLTKKRQNSVINNRKMVTMS